MVYLRRPGFPPIEPDLEDRCEIVEEIYQREGGPAEHRWRHRFHVLAAPRRRLPSGVAPLYDRRFARAGAEVAASWQPDIIQVEHDNIAYCGPFLARSGSRAPRIVTCHEPGVLAALDQARATSGRQRLAHRIDAATWRRYWANSLPSFDTVVTFTEADREVIEQEVTGLRYALIGLGIDIPVEPLSAAGSGGGVLYVGGYRHPPNGEAALRLMRAIMPAVRARVPGLPLTLLGADPTLEMRQTAGPEDLVTGRVPDVTPYLDAAEVVALPIDLGGGMRVKLLEALAAGKAVVASPRAAAGLDMTDRKEILLAKTDAEFADAIVMLIGDEDARARIGAAARAWALANLSWDSRVVKYERLYRSLLATPRGVDDTT
jgi:glycosyltransferase involved in cell wall biosynthesis